MLDLDAEMIPGIGAAGLTLGQPAADILRLGPPDEVEPRIGCRILKYGPVWVFEDDAGDINQVCVFESYRGKLAGLIGIGSRVAEVEEAFGPLEYMEAGEYQLDLGTPWQDNDWSVSVGRVRPAKGEPGWRDAQIECICVSS